MQSPVDGKHTKKEKIKMIKIVQASEVGVGALTLLIYGFPGVGKTSLALTSAKPILLDFDGGSYRALHRDRAPMVRIESWRDVKDLAPSDLHPYKTVVVDTVGSCLDSLALDLMSNDPRLGRAGSLTLQGYGQLKSSFRSWLLLLHSAGLDVSLLAHTDEERSGENTVERIVAAGSSKNEVYRQSDLIGRVLATPTGRVLSCDPSETAHGKSCGLDGPVKINPEDSNTLADIISQVRAKFNQKSADQNKESKRLESVSEKVAGIETIEGYNKFLDELSTSNAKAADKRILNNAAKKAGLKYDKETKRFIYA